MKRSKVFLSVATCILGVAAFAATKANLNTTKTFVTAHGQASFTKLCTAVQVTGGQICTGGSAHLPLFTATHRQLEAFVISVG